MPTELEVKTAINLILSDKRAYTGSLNYCVNYCRAALQMKGDDLKIQVLYILNNIRSWRHPDAKEVRKVLKEFAGVK